jgi:DNA-binding SARP family transcriptional activator/tetratricopeptide (TPR) repeat protein
MRRLNFELLGSPRVSLAGRPVSFPTRKALALLAYLALTPGRPSPRDRLAELLWSDVGEKQARNSLRQTIFSIRRALGAAAACLRADGEGLALDAGDVDIDVVRFEALVADGAPAALERAVEVYRGELLDGLMLQEQGFDEWLVGERERLLAQALGAHERLLRHHTERGALEPAVQVALRLVTLDPLQEGAHRTLMHLYAAQGRRGAALRQYQVCLGVLRRELGVEPGLETKRLYHDSLQRRPTRLPAEVAGARESRWPALATGPARPRAEEPPLVGRRVELQRLQEIFEATWAPRGQTVAIVGEAGIGKTRLVEAAAEEFRRRGGRVLVGRAYEAEQVLPFRPWVDAFRSGEALAVEALARLKRVWRAELGRLFPEWADATTGAPPDEDSLRLFEAVTQLVAHLAGDRPLLLVLEDMHWADESSLRLLSFLAHRIERAAVTVAVTLREEEIGANAIAATVVRDLAHEHVLAQVTLAPLSRRDTGALVTSLAPAGSGATELARLSDQAWEASRGHPFMVVEIMRALEQGAVPRTSAALPLPERVREVIVGRLGRLGERSRQLAGVSAVIGRPFDFRLLQRAAGLSELDTAEGVEELVRRRILQGVGDQLAFVHDRTREVAYAQLLPPVRRLLHGLVARALEEVHAGDLGPHAAEIGLHHVESEAWLPAVKHLHQAAAAAYFRGAHRESATCLEQALAALGHLPETRQTVEYGIDLRFNLRNALLPLWEHRRILEILQEAQALAEGIAQYHWAVAHYDESLEQAQRALSVADRRGDTALALSARFYRAQVLHARGAYRAAAEILGDIVGSSHDDLVAERFNMVGVGRVFAAAWWAYALAELGEFEAGIACGHRAVRDGLRFGQPFALTNAYACLALVCLRQGQVDEAISLLERTRDLSGVGDITNVYPMAEWFLGYAYTLAGRAAEALPLLEPVLSIDPFTGEPQWRAWLAEALVAAGRRDDARRVIESAVALGAERAERGHRAWALRTLGDVLAAEGDEGAEAAYREALATAAELGMRPLEAHCRFGLGELYRARGKPDARSELAAAVELFRAMDMTFWLPAAEAALATVDRA